MKIRLLLLHFLFPVLLFSQVSTGIERRLDSLHQRAVQLLRREKLAEFKTVLDTLLPLSEAHSETFPRYYARAWDLQFLFLEPSQWESYFQAMEQFRPDTNDVDWARTLSVKAALLRGRYPDSAAILYGKALRLVERDSGTNSLMYGKYCHLRAVALYLAGNYTAADTFFQKTLKIATGNDPARLRDTIDLANCLFDMGEYHNRKGELEKLEATQIRSCELRKRAIGQNSRAYADALHNLSVYYARTGQYACAREGFQKVRDIILAKKQFMILGDSLNLGTVLTSLASSFKNTGNLESAEATVIEALSIRAKVPGKQDPSYYTTLLELGQVYYRQNRYSQADSIWIIVERWARKAKDYIHLATVLQNRGDLYQKKGNNDRAWEFCEEALFLHRDSLKWGEDHPETIKCIHSLASIRPRTPEGKRYLADNVRLDLGYLRKQAIFSSEIEMQRIMAATLPDFEELYGLLFENGSPEMLTLAYDLALALKENLLKNAATIQNTLAKTCPEKTGIWEVWKIKRRELARTIEQPRSPGRDLKETQLRDTISSLEKQLASCLSFPEPVTCKQVYQALKPGEAAIEFVQYRESDAEGGQGARYGALVLRAGDTAPRFVPLCMEAELKRLWSVYEKTGKSADFNQLYSDSIKNGRTLYALLWKPVEALLHKTDTVLYYSPTGFINLFNLRAIKDKRALYLTQKFVTLSSTGSLVNDTAAIYLPDYAVLFGGVEENQMQPMRMEVVRLADTLTRMGIPLSLNTGSAGTENKFLLDGENLHRSTSAFLHMAVHGYFNLPVDAPKKECRPLSDLDPMFQSFLQLGRDTAGAGTDGRVTAYDISTLDLSNVGLAYLSSCKTGLGEVRGFEGVFGMVRGLKIAGVKKIIVALNGVPTPVTRQMTAKFYRYWLSGKGTVTIREAFYRAQEEMRADNSDPFHWASFILIE